MEINKGGPPIPARVIGEVPGFAQGAKAIPAYNSPYTVPTDLQNSVKGFSSILKNL